MDELHWILLIIALGAFIGMLWLIMTKEKKSEVSESMEDGRRVVIGHDGKIEFDGRQKEYDSYRVVKNAMKDADKVSNMFDRFKHDIDKVKFKHMSHDKPKIKKKYSFIEYDRGTYKSTPCYQCSAGRFGVIGSGLTPKQAYDDWLKAVIQ